MGDIKTCDCVSTCRPRSPVAAGLELESAAPPMDLERPTQLEGLQVHPLGPPTRSSASTPLPSPITQLSRPNPTVDVLEAELANPVATSGAAAEPDTSVKHVIIGENPSIPERGVETASATTWEIVAEGREGEPTQPNVVVSSQSGSTVVSSQSGSTGPNIISKEQLESFAEGNCLMCAALQLCLSSIQQKPTCMGWHPCSIQKRLRHMFRTVLSFALQMLSNGKAKSYFILCDVTAFSPLQIARRCCPQTAASCKVKLRYNQQNQLLQGTNRWRRRPLEAISRWNQTMQQYLLQRRAWTMPWKSWR